MIRRPPRSTHCISSAASDVYKRQAKAPYPWRTQIMRPREPRMTLRCRPRPWQRQAWCLSGELSTSGTCRRTSQRKNYSTTCTLVRLRVCVCCQKKTVLLYHFYLAKWRQLSMLIHRYVVSRFGIASSRLDGASRVCRPPPSCCLLYTSPSPRDLSTSRMPSSA